MMWFLIFILSLFIAFLLKSLLFLSKPSAKLDGTILPPGPTSIPIIGNFIWLFKLTSRIEPILLDLHAKYGPIVSLPIPFSSHPAIFINDHSLAHQVLVQNGAVCSDRPPPQPITKLITSDNRVIFSSGYGPTWRLLRRNLMSEVLNPSRLKSYASSRKWALDILTNRLDQSVWSNGPVVEVLDHFRFSITSLFVDMVFGEKVEDEAKMKEIADVQRRFMFGLVRGFQTLNLGPRWLNKILFRKGWNQFNEIRQQQKHLLLPFIRARKKVVVKQEMVDKNSDEFTIAYVDTLMDLEDPREKRAFNEEELMHQCSEILNSGTDTMSITLQWTMANVVKYPRVQKRLVEDIKKVVGVEKLELKDEDLQKMHYLKAVVMEALRLHPPGHYVVPHTVTEDIILAGRYTLPKNCTVNFMVAEIGRDSSVWDEPMEFKPERFMKDGGNVQCDITGSKEIMMIPFGAGRRICPGLGLSMLLLEYLVANLVWKYEWEAVDGVGVDLTERQEATWVMKNPLQAQISPRLNK
ncbi:putative cytochrome P450 [Rosa chinensis]|uniref:Putative cytochrome P450 n=1 Tax=Rosa chinensis TaxID=74649 RepID=A0A2P6RVR2_ROSCH|nr:cytochrome P450 89A2 isoform X1 [Rosa chinensis]PRQ50517.1 putative cytochrome P450 [Rosa chinensis]